MPFPLPTAANNPLLRLRAVWAVAAVALALTAAGCTADRSEPAPDPGTDYYPVALNNFWIYAVSDSTWSQATPAQPSRVQVSNYQFRETVSESFKDAAGQTAYRLVRARRVPPATAWVDDSVFTLSATAQSVVLGRNNLRTVELIFPVREGRPWNLNAYNNNSNDTITAETRRYSRVAQPLAGTVGGTALTFPNTLTTANEGTAQANDIYYIRTYRQVFAKGVGPVLRRRRNFANYYLNGAGGTVTFYPGSYFYGFSRRETLVDYGPR